jgi:SHS2 domain-containing protein
MFDGGPGATPVGPLDAWLVCDASSELQPALRRLARDPDCQPAVASFASGDLTVEPLPVEHTSHPTFGYLVRARGRSVVWAPEFLHLPAWASGTDLVFADAAGWSRPIRFAHGAGGHAAAVDVARDARAAGVRRLIFAHIGRPTIRAIDAGGRLPFGELGIEGRAYLVRRPPGDRPGDRACCAASQAELEAPPEVGHEALPHTADAGIRAWAPGLAQVFAEAGMALGELAADVDATASSRSFERVRLEAADLAALAYGWLNELVSLVDARASAVGTMRKVQIALEDPPRQGWRLDASVGLVPVDGRRARRRIDVKSVTYHGLIVDSHDGRWTAKAYLDV